MARKIEKKVWYDVLAPKIFDSKTLGSVPTTDPQKMVGKTIEADLLTLTGDASKYYMNFIFKIDKVNGNKLQTRLFKYECARDFVARMIQLRTSKIYTNKIFDFKDGRMRIKSVAVSNRRTTYTIQKKIRAKINKILEQKSKGMTREEFIKEIISGNIQNLIRSEANKIYPLRRFEIIKTHVLSS